MHMCLSRHLSNVNEPHNTPALPEAEKQLCEMVTFQYSK